VAPSRATHSRIWAEGTARCRRADDCSGRRVARQGCLLSAPADEAEQARCCLGARCRFTIGGAPAAVASRDDVAVLAPADFCNFPGMQQSCTENDAARAVQGTALRRWEQPSAPSRERKCSPFSRPVRIRRPAISWPLPLPDKRGLGRWAMFGSRSSSRAAVRERRRRHLLCRGDQKRRKQAAGVRVLRIGDRRVGRVGQLALAEHSCGVGDRRD